MSSVQKKKSKSRSRSRSPVRKTTKPKIDLSQVREELESDSRPVKIFKMEKLITIFSYVAVFFLSLYITSGIFDDLYREQYEVTKSTVFVSNVITFIMLGILMLIRHYNPSDTLLLFFVQITLTVGIAVTVIVSASSMKDLLEDRDSFSQAEDTTQYVLSLLSIIFAGICSLLIMVNVIVARYG